PGGEDLAGRVIASYVARDRRLTTGALPEGRSEPGSAVKTGAAELPRSHLPRVPRSARAASHRMRRRGSRHSDGCGRGATTFLDTRPGRPSPERPSPGDSNLDRDPHRLALLRLSAGCAPPVGSAI